jgi:hypothetical protein
VYRYVITPTVTPAIPWNTSQPRCPSAARVKAVPIDRAPSTNAYAPTSSTSVPKPMPGHTTIAMPNATAITPRTMSPRDIRESEFSRFCLIVAIAVLPSVSVDYVFIGCVVCHSKYRAMSAAA